MTDLMSENSQAPNTIILYHAKDMATEIVRPDADGFSFIVHRLGEPMEPQPTLRDVVSHVNYVVAHSAVASLRLINSFYADRTEPLPKKERDRFKVDLDNVATDVMEAGFNGGITPRFGVFVDDCEGLKELRKEEEEKEARRRAGIPEPEKPKIDLHILRGYYGPKDGKTRAYEVVDPVEGTTRASGDLEGAIATASGVLCNPGEPSRLPFIPPEESDAKYMRRLVANRQLRGIHPQMRVRDIVKFAMERIKVEDPSQVEIVALERARNNALIDEIRESGATFTPIDSGDLVPGFSALRPVNMFKTKPEDRRVIISMGSGGKTEALIAAIAAKAVGGVFFGWFEDGDGNASLQFPGLKGNDWVPYKPEECFVSLAPVTGVDKKWGLELPRVDPHVNGIIEYRVPVLDITSVGDNFFRTIHTFQD